ncbi:hypothetical protein GCM10027258_26010 [Amycolatopsis stemonae]
MQVDEAGQQDLAVRFEDFGIFGDLDGADRGDHAVLDQDVDRVALAVRACPLDHGAQARTSLTLGAC